MSSTTPPAVRAYLVRVRTALADLPAGEVEEIIEDVRPHLVQIGAELGDDAAIEPLTERLGSPEDYAAELRAAGGYPPAPASPAPEGTRPPSRLGARFAAWSLVVVTVAVGVAAYAWGLERFPDGIVFVLALAPLLGASAWYVVRFGTDSVTSLPEVRNLRSALPGDEDGVPGRIRVYLRSLKPGWWLFCAVVPVLLGLLAFGNRGEWVLIPLLAVVGGVALWAGPRSRTDRRWLWFAVPVSALAVGGLLGLTGSILDHTIGPRQYSGPYPTGTQMSDGAPVLQYGSEQLRNVYVFDAEGKPLTEVYLYTEDGRPITVPRYACEPETGAERRTGEDNLFPRPRLEHGAYDESGNRNGYNAYVPGCRELEGVPFTAAIPKQPG
ncbi:HAAS signaling domain-containing protein [Amycolatopsis cihanbeyliensis]|uniref:Uncharacterized protein n=1 Tax=Amycolatopsis cihanbeyliensis TaxID=1128664 RepID=A0A542DH20_AMYCI|nr:hypothetical protein [Amycolatopsis cihanbeyliensis]TQJ02364.1 hypothetical protein FB471_2090 [Amycolatopsis cihanbeyliensis]